ncbi:MAG: RagB/SusD family nutrient uptake outer membrane protein [Prevotella sp.]|nr:RagB/SusD family nutrient uptake outer membrane protein [Prevotella sp.]
MTNKINNIRKRSPWATCKVALCSLFVLTTFLTSCSDFLQIEPKEIIVLDKYWDEEADVEGVVAGCYSSMQTQSVISRMMVWGEFRSDNIVGGRNYENDIQIANIFKENINASNTYAKWGDFYNVINRCNIVLKYAPEVAQKDPSYTPSKLNATIAEVSALRDLMYFYLIRSFCDVPYITEPYLDDNQQMDIPASSFDDVLTSLIEDLESKQSMAVKRYPLTQTYYQRGRITQDAIHALLADLYLWKQDYANVVRYADMVINAKLDEYETEMRKRMSSANGGNELIDGYPLISDAYTTGNYYGTAFEGIFGSGNSSESIFELIFMNDDDMLANGAVSSLYGNATTFPGLARPADFIGTDVSDESFNIFLSKYDVRFYENLQPVQGQSNTYGINKYVTSSAMVDLSKAEIQSSYSSPYADGKCHSNWIIYRLTDVMLMKAEALVEMSPEGEDEYSKQQADTLLRQAFSIVNAINKRSNCSKEDKNLVWDMYSSKSSMRNLVLEERQRELMFEGKRWYDLVRRSRRDGNTSYLVGTVSRKGTSGSGALSSKLSRMEAIYWPYHIDELKVNGNLKQNPAFGSGEDSSIVPH